MRHFVELEEPPFAVRKPRKLWRFCDDFRVRRLVVAQGVEDADAVGSADLVQNLKMGGKIGRPSRPETRDAVGDRFDDRRRLDGDMACDDRRVRQAFLLEAFGKLSCFPLVRVLVLLDVGRNAKAQLGRQRQNGDAVVAGGPVCVSQGIERSSVGRALEA